MSPKPFRILDLGCHDGFVSLWLARQIDDAAVHVDGVELNEEAVRIASKRASDDGLPGEYKIGLAEDAPDLFEPGTYDAVIAFELIEHVPDVRRFLDAAEIMLKPGGRVYLSTPDGTFGSGQNPHHLRVYRALDLAELCRRRGRLENMIVGGDGVSVISYTPLLVGGKGEVAIYCGPCWQPWHPSDIETKGLGGSETAAVRLADALGEQGYTVTVYADTVDAGICFRQTVFRHYSHFDPTVPRTAVISSRIPSLFDAPLNARAKVLWMHDTDYGPQITPERVDRLDAIMVLSRWHESHVKQVYPWIDPGKLRVTQNGIEPRYFEREHAEKINRVVYSSSPDRGLDLLLDVWPQVRAQVPDAVLAYCYSDVYDAVADSNPSIREFRDKIREVARQDGVVNMGSLPQQGLALLMLESRVWVAPSYSTPSGQPFYETFCIGAWEAWKAGCYRVGASWGALAERSLDWEVLPDKDGRPNREDLVQGLVQGLTNGEPKRFPGEFLDVTWAAAARDFDDTFHRIAIKAPIDPDVAIEGGLVGAELVPG